MKKAKEYVADFQAADDKDGALAGVLIEMHQETVILMRQRGVRSNAGMLAIFNEVDDKFRSFARQVGEGVYRKSFAVVIGRFHPKVYLAWIRAFPGRAHGLPEAVRKPHGSAKKKFTLHWLGGRTEVVEGDDIADACRRAGIGGGAVAALDYYEDGDQKVPVSGQAKCGCVYHAEEGSSCRHDLKLAGLSAD